MLKFKEWLAVREANAHTRLRRDAALGLKPITGLGSINGTSSALPWEVEKIEKKIKKK